MIKLHHLEDSRSQRVIWLLEVLGVSYEVKRYKRDPKTGLAPGQALELNPLGKFPFIEINSVVLAESGAIFEYLLSLYDTENYLHPKTTDKKYRDYLFWMHFSEGSLMWPFVIRLLHSKTLEKVPFFMKPVAKLIFVGIEKGYLAKTINSALAHVENTLSSSRYLLGDKLSACDILMSFPLEAACSGRQDMSQYPSIQNYVKSLKQKAEYVKAIETGGPYSY